MNSTHCGNCSLIVAYRRRLQTPQSSASTWSKQTKQTVKIWFGYKNNILKSNEWESWREVKYIMLFRSYGWKHKLMSRQFDTQNYISQHALDRSMFFSFPLPLRWKTDRSIAEKSWSSHFVLRSFILSVWNTPSSLKLRHWTRSYNNCMQYSST